LSVQDVIDSFTAGKGPKSPVEIVTSLTERMADRIGDFVENIETEVGACEEAVGETSFAASRPRLAKVRRQVAAVRRFLAPQRDALDRLYRQGSDLLGHRAVNLVREDADRITRNLEDLDLAREQAIVLQEELLSQLATEQNTRIFVLSIVAAIFLPLSFVTGLFGMNVAGLPGTENPLAFVLLGVFMLVTVGALLAVFRWKRWI
jgi:zinc transporter